MKIKWIVTGFVALVVAVAVAGVAILSTMEFEELRAVIEAEAKEATGRELEIAGSIDLKISLTPAIALEDVRFANAAWGSRADMVSSRRVELEVAPVPPLPGGLPGQARGGGRPAGCAGGGSARAGGVSAGGRGPRYASAALRCGGAPGRCRCCQASARSYARQAAAAVV